MTKALIEHPKLYKRIWPITILVAFLILVGSANIAFSKKSKAEIQYELEVEYINNRKDLEWSEKVKARVEAHERIFEPEKRKIRLLKEAAERRKLLGEDKSKGSEKGERTSEKRESKTSILISVYFYGIIALTLLFWGYKVYLKHCQKRITIDGYKLKKSPVLILILKLSALSFLIFCFGLGIIEQVQNYMGYQDDRANNSPVEKEATPKNEIPFSIAANVISPNTVVLKIKTNTPEIIEGVVFLSKENGGNSSAKLKYEEEIQINDGLKVVIIEGQQNGLDRGNYLAGIRMKTNGVSEQTIEKTVSVYLPDVLKPEQASNVFVNANKTDKLESCYDLGYRFGMCSTKAMKGIACDPANDIVIPEKCRNKAETKRGIEAGVKDANAMIVGKKTDNSKTFSGLPALRNRLVGKEENEVIEVLGRPSRTGVFAGKKCWIYGNTFTSEDIGIVFDGGKVLTVTYY